MDRPERQTQDTDLTEKKGASEDTGGESPAESGIPEKTGKTGGNAKASVKDGLISWGKTIGLAVILAFVIKSFIIVNASVVSGSMERTIMTSDRIICNRLAYIASPPKRFDIIAFDYLENGAEPIIYVKRIIGLPGETIRIIDGKVYIGDSQAPLADDFVNGVPIGSYGPFEVPQDCYFVLGDNRNSSYDSKSWSDPYLPREQILGKAMFRYYPKFKALK